ncbi:hypothetical protein AVEN_69673-1 [Araneus ventricosus]|uniref:Uncharacterized protein n=1 Tax=Araneus ventricosus TaxID=182803 RepID=A0A4Y2JLQ1_ARAVE|nr:hypothetical protein AVEN_69673-1 [Araneus ventricosus]
MRRHCRSGRVYKGRAWIRESSVDRLERLWSFVCSASWEAGELSAVIVAITDLLTVCVAKSQSDELLLPASCCLLTLIIWARSIVSCYLCYVFSCTFVTKPSFSIILPVGLFTPHTHRKNFVTLLTIAAVFLKLNGVQVTLAATLYIAFSTF